MRAKELSSPLPRAVVRKFDEVKLVITATKAIVFFMVFNTALHYKQFPPNLPKRTFINKHLLTTYKVQITLCCNILNKLQISSH
jgi:hypothetical protein